MGEPILDVGQLAGLCGWTGTQWVPLACDSSGKLLFGTAALVEVREISANTLTVDFTGLDARNRGPYLLWGTIYNSGSSSENYFIYFNGDYTNTNYYIQYIYCDTTAVGANRLNKPAPIYVVYGKSASFWSYIYLDARGWQRAMGQTEMDDPQYLWFSTWALSRTISATNLTDIRIAGGTYNPIGPGSRFVLFKFRG
jgi:hypothetical protein